MLQHICQLIDDMSCPHVCPLGLADLNMKQKKYTSAKLTTAARLPHGLFGLCCVMK